MERGAKPEFFGITALSVDGATLLTRRTRGAERLFSAGVTMADVDLGALGDALAAGADITETPALPARLRPSPCCSGCARPLSGTTDKPEVRVCSPRDLAATISPNIVRELS